MATADDLLAIEQIKALKARYWRAVDLRDPALLRGVFTDDAVTDFRGSAGPEDAHLLHRDPDAFVANLVETLAGVVTVHHGHTPEIILTSATTATGIWPMEDRLWVDRTVSQLPFSRLHGWGHYHESYRRTAIGWRISATKLTRLRIETD